MPSSKQAQRQGKAIASEMRHQCAMEARCAELARLVRSGQLRSTVFDRPHEWWTVAGRLQQEKQAATIEALIEHAERSFNDGGNAP